ncbi:MULTISPECIES: DUF5330 domain-containing protein [Rhizobium]|uniref:DUF5330 domain-containing protein n=1 Tax=Rhizobium wuzhouense TaxID=1986026 RepID=A0ABX5NZ58_9HYPH|nr:MULTISPECIES: DUF5330 domain-containing protein [Rhizobium]PYB76966.1 hypothetical protein DMY87_00810 [Rhizobium wuzhouense]RKE85608.1 hypothetical protein DFO46_2409 [Rhizobium sp. AG855]
MWFLIKGTFYCSVALVALSYLGSPPREEAAGGPTFEIGDAFAAATDAYAYMSSLCIEKPDVCEKGKQTFQALGQRAREGALVAYQLLDKQFTDDGSAKLAADVPLPKKGTVEIVKPEVEEADAAPALAATPVNAAQAEAIVTGTVVPSARPKNLPKPYTPPKP